MAEPIWKTELTDGSVRDELDRLHPERMRLRPRDLTGISEAMDVVEQIWAPTFDRARRLPPARLHERVGGEYSFVETVRHLLFVSDAWLRRMVLGDPGPLHEWGVPPNLSPDAPPDTGPELDEVLHVREVRNAQIRDHVDSLTESDLRIRVGGPWDQPNLPDEHRARVIDCFRVMFREEWWHHQFATRDLGSIDPGQGP